LRQFSSHLNSGGATEARVGAPAQTISL
jgi:hypothetical protein